jgi:hypothetical protein
MTSRLKGNGLLTPIMYCEWREKLSGRSQFEGNVISIIRETATSTSLSCARQSHKQTAINLTHARQ